MLRSRALRSRGWCAAADVHAEAAAAVAAVAAGPADPPLPAPPLPAHALAAAGEGGGEEGRGRAGGELGRLLPAARQRRRLLHLSAAASSSRAKASARVRVRRAGALLALSRRARDDAVLQSLRRTVVMSEQVIHVISQCCLSSTLFLVSSRVWLADALCAKRTWRGCGRCSDTRICWNVTCILLAIILCAPQSSARTSRDRELLRT
eukprot:2323726-Rhodomonas_salina.2